MNKHIEALKLALEALESCGSGHITDGGNQWYDEKLVDNSITAIKEALREHAMREVQRLGQEIEQEPIGTVKELFTQTAWERLDLRGSTKVYLNTTPPQRGKEPVKYSDYEPDGVHHNKPQQEQEPVALEAVYETIIQWDEGGGKRSRRELARRIVALYTTPPQCTWVGLTDKEMYKLWLTVDEEVDRMAFGKAVEAKLKDLNI